ncbi:MAG: 50S ribosomal protein L1 [bacterium]|nr:50S ribosomal protein L1 [bacterium]
MERRSKKYKEAQKHIEKDKEYALGEGLSLAKKTSTTKFDSTVELHVALGVDPKHADQNIRGTVSLPAGTGKEVRVAVFAEIDDAKKAMTAGADFAGNEEMLTKLDKQDIDFDVLIATPKLMAKLGKYAKVLGPKGLMPNPKSGTVNADVEKAVKEAKAGKIEYRVDSNGIIHTAIGKVSFSEQDLKKNIDVILAAIKGAKPASVKSSYFKSAFLTTSMGPSVKLSLSEIQ